MGGSTTRKIFVAVHAGFRKGKKGWLQNRYFIKLGRLEKACLTRVSEKKAG